MKKAKHFDINQLRIEYLKSIHPFIDYNFLVKNINTNSLKVLSEIESLIRSNLFFPMAKYENTDFSLTYETGPLTILDYIHLAGNVYIQEGRELFLTTDLT